MTSDSVTRMLTLLWAVLLEHPAPVAVGLIGLTVYAWHRLARVMEVDEPQTLASREIVVWDAMQRARQSGVTHVDFTAKRRKVG